MFNHIVVPLDGSYRAATAIRLAMKLARLWHSQLVLVHVADTPHVALTAPRLEDVREPDAFVHTQLIAMAKEIAHTGVDVRVAMPPGAPTTGILHAVNTMDRPLLVMTTHGHTGNAAPLGHVARAIIVRATTPILLIKTGHGHDAHKEVTTAVTAVTAVLDGSPNDSRIAPVASGLADALAVPLELLNVIPDAHFASLRSYCPPEEDYSFLLDEELLEANRIGKARMRVYLKRLAAESVVAGTDVQITVKLSVNYDPAEVIAAHWCERPGHLGVIYNRERTGFRRLVPASVLAQVIRDMPCALLIVRGDHYDDRARANPVDSVRTHLVSLRIAFLAGADAPGVASIVSWRAPHTRKRGVT